MPQGYLRPNHCPFGVEASTICAEAGKQCLSRSASHCADAGTSRLVQPHTRAVEASGRSTRHVRVIDVLYIYVIKHSLAKIMSVPVGFTYLVLGWKHCSTKRDRLARSSASEPH